MIGLVILLLLLLPTLTIWFSLDYKRNVSDGVVSGMGTLFSPTPTPTPSLVKTSRYLCAVSSLIFYLNPWVAL